MKIVVFVSVFLLTVLALSYVVSDSDAQGISAGGTPGIKITRDADGPPSQCALSPQSWECRPCDQDGKLTYGGCWCRFCINSQGKTVENAMDMREIACPKPAT